MTLRLPDFYYTDKMLDGVNPQMWPKQMSLSFNQGEDVKFDTYLNVNGQPLDLGKYDLLVLVKKDNWADRLIWRGTSDNGIFQIPEKPGFFKVWMPSLVTQYLLPGSYHFGFRLKEKIGALEDVWDTTISIREVFIEILRSTDMPNPSLPMETEVFTQYNKETGRWSYVTRAKEATFPYPVPVLASDGGSVDAYNPPTSVQASPG